MNLDGGNTSGFIGSLAVGTGLNRGLLVFVTAKSSDTTLRTVKAISFNGISILANSVTRVAVSLSGTAMSTDVFWMSNPPTTNGDTDGMVSVSLSGKATALILGAHSYSNVSQVKPANVGVFGSALAATAAVNLTVTSSNSYIVFETAAGITGKTFTGTGTSRWFEKARAVSAEGGDRTMATAGWYQTSRTINPAGSYPLIMVAVELAQLCPPTATPTPTPTATGGPS